MFIIIASARIVVLTNKLCTIEMKAMHSYVKPMLLQIGTYVLNKHYVLL